jgi:hypothetical protein
MKVKLTGVINESTLAWNAGDHGSLTIEAFLFCGDPWTEPTLARIPLPIPAHPMCGPGTGIEIELTFVPKTPTKPITEPIKIPPSLGMKPRRAAKRHGRGGLEKLRKGMK